jgi:hypothetical protein
MELDILILTVYFICIGYVIYQMALSVEAELEDQVVLVADREGLEAAVRSQLINQGFPEDAAEGLTAAPAPLSPTTALRLAVPEPRTITDEAGQPVEGQVVVQVLPQGPHPLQPVPHLTVQILNQTQGLQITVDWDRSSLSRMNNQVRRVIRPTPGMRLDLGLPQVTSVVNPNQFLSTAITSEDTFNRDPVTQLLQMATPLLDIEKMAVMPPPARKYALELFLQLTPLTGRGARSIVLLVPFRFMVNVLPAQPAIPLLNWIMRR